MGRAHGARNTVDAAANVVGQRRSRLVRHDSPVVCPPVFGVALAQGSLRLVSRLVPFLSLELSSQPSLTQPLSEFFCQPAYAYSSPYPFAVNPDAPQFPFVLPTLLYRTFVQAWLAPFSALLSPMSYAALAVQRGSAVFMNAASQPSIAVHSQPQVTDEVEVESDYDYDWSMSRDEVMR